MQPDALTPFINPKEITLTDRRGREKVFILSEIPATYSREIVACWTANALPKLGEYSVNESMMFKMMSYVGVKVGDKVYRLVTRELIDNHADFRLLATLEKEMAQYNWDFFLGEELLNLRERFMRIFSIWLTQILTTSLRESFKREKRPSTN